MVTIKDENGFEVRIIKEKVQRYDEFDSYINSFEFFKDGRRVFENILVKNKVYANVDPLGWIKDGIIEAVNDKKHVHFDFIEPDIFIEVMPEDCYFNRIWHNKCKCEDKDSNFVIVFYIDSRNFNKDDPSSYVGCNISITLFVSKEQLINFAYDIEKEYSE